ncbi:unnamed protein product [Protopolystoma xenopodis]|uniref:U2A'/phosphoprotein 32 family A C-terminal domain-containing protein n=1 Tax=Protopolystoma xenopodis TaxID=117903 RepID=A0A448WK98_9PLAT|nr:unnamed protein product [Protopolystoma xenopodis]
MIRNNHLTQLDLDSSSTEKLLLIDLSDNQFERLMHVGGPFPQLRSLILRSNRLSKLGKKDIFPICPYLINLSNLFTTL